MVGNRDNARLAIRARLVQVFAWIFIALTVMQLVLTGWLTFRTQEIVVTAPGGDPGTPLPLIAAAVAGLTPIALLIVALALCAVALAWIHRAHASLREQGIALDNSPGWAVGSYFIPLVNLVAPYRAMRELYNRSHGEVDELAHATVDEVQTWWFTYVIGLTLAMLLAFKVWVDLLTNIVFLTPVWAEFVMAAFSAALLALACFLLNRLVWAITRAQGSAAHVSTAFE